ncbi:hypothetical protein [Denitrobaculum tricleocarpae]|uniref:Uncharacterized protein n=1 Tax=Denitrobaculum tricleocarpae TaxID=2591009 RepID=A0A545TTG9_9PROT|nr:hypothetical protein [Denitrobaculum tricleocarpae]TQV80514.1 hypothetical protein FKG95_10070 [Denitrobaculum tricleocarpae]
MLVITIALALLDPQPINDNLIFFSQESKVKTASSPTALADQKVRFARVSETVPAEAVRRQHEARRILAGWPAAEHLQQIAKQKAIEARVVYQVDGKIVAIHYRNQTGLLTSHSDRDDRLRLMKEAALRGLKREMLDDFMDIRTSHALRRKYGPGLTMTRYETGQAPTAGMLHAEIFSNPSEITLTTKTPRVSLDTETLEKHERVRISQASRLRSLRNSPHP